MNVSKFNEEVVKSTVNEDPQAVSDTFQPIDGIGEPGSDPRSTGTRSPGDGEDTGASATDSKTLGKSGISHVVNDGIGAGSGIRNGAVRNIGGSGGTDPGGDSGVNRGQR